MQNLQGKKALITGGLGMIGSNIARRLVDLGVEVTILDALIEPFGGNFFNIKDIEDKIRINIADIRDKEAIKVLVKDKDYIFNLAGQVSHNDSLKNPFLDADINYMGHLNVLEAVK
ncbi:NAD-dependent epimerase, partial [candidate division KSB1 bacterium 4484_87]